MVRTFLIALLMAFSDLEKRKHKNFLGKRYTPARQYWTKTLGSLLKQVTKTIKQITDMMVECGQKQYLAITTATL